MEGKAEILRMAAQREMERFQTLDDTIEMLSRPTLKPALYLDFLCECGSLITTVFTSS